MIDTALEATREAGLRYVSDAIPGITRRRTGKGFTYYSPDGRLIRDRDQRKRIDGLAIPPAYANVWICPDPRGHIQATARDKRGRKQYRYHPSWVEVRDAAKFDRVTSFAHALPALRRRVEADLRRDGLPRERVLAGIVCLLESTLIRVGNEEYARANNSYGLTTLRAKHVRGNGRTLRFRFRGKSGRFHEVSVADARLARLVKRCQDLPGQELFQYLDADGAAVSVGSSDVNDYLRDATSQEFSAKDIRTWHATVYCAQLMLEENARQDRKGTSEVIVNTLSAVADRLGNTRAICKKCYVHPSVIEWFEDGTLRRRAERGPKKRRGLDEAETATLNALESAATTGVR